MVSDEMVNDETMFVREHNPLLRTLTMPCLTYVP